MSEEDMPTLEQSYNRWYRYHKVSADNRWLDYRSHILNYPDKVNFRDKSWALYGMYCGKRSDPDSLYFIREVSKQEALFDEDFNPRRNNYWRWPEYVVNETGIYYEVTSINVARFIPLDNSDDPSFACWINKFDTTIKQRKVPMSRTSGWCDDPLSYEINEHSMSVDVSKAGRSIRLELSECSELASFLATAKDKIKEAKIASLKEQQDALQKALREVEVM